MLSNVGPLCVCVCENVFGLIHQQAWFTGVTMETDFNYDINLWDHNYKKLRLKIISTTGGGTTAKKRRLSTL